MEPSQTFFRFHVTMWFGMIILMAASLVYSIQFLSKESALSDLKARELALTGFFMASLGLITGAIRARLYLGVPFGLNDPKLDGAAVTMLIYLAYFVLRGSVDDPQKRGRIAAVFNIFAFVMMIVFIGILPRMPGIGSLHPGNAGNPAFSSYEPSE
ncbi:MAG: cytochrome c biogenesis protein CcsA [Owenweeksia sp.]|nr:cytochrome c biogenesis protein CcsA [Owenweeksia sp.]